MLYSNKSSEDLLKELKYYNLLYQHNINDRNFVMPNSFYYGIDPNNDFIHIGHISNLFAIKIIHKFVKKFILVIGDFTCNIGDPTNKLEVRNTESINTKSFGLSIKNNFTKILDNFKVNYDIKYNSEWLNIKIDKYIKYASLFNIREIYSSEIFKQRRLVNNPVYLHEIIYPTIQAYDYLTLYSNFNCTLQIGGQDQWTNILAGGQIIRKLHKINAYAITTPLILDAKNQKIGKSNQNVFKISINKNIFFNIFSLMNTSDDIINKISGMIPDNQKINNFFDFATYMLSIIYSKSISDRVMSVYYKLYNRITNFNELNIESIDDLILNIKDKNYNLLSLCKLLDEKMNSKLLEIYMKCGFISINFIKVQNKNIINQIKNENKYIVLELKRKFIIFKNY
ncbi:tyrosyl-tRNA synthetase [uncultured bacterium]|nr:tyrosyl-tRNA synthetase [uncultured bacterium]